MKKRICHHFYTGYLIRVVLLLLLLMPLSPGWASGWNDFKLDIGDGYSIYKSSSMDVCLSKPYSQGVCGTKESGVGPVSKYINAPGYVLTLNLGRTPVIEDDGYEHQSVDPSKQYYFIVDKATETVSGPLSASEFLARPEIVALAPLDWQNPTNPNELPWQITLVIVLVALVALTVIALVLAAPVVIVVLLLVRCTRRYRQKDSNAQAEGYTRADSAQVAGQPPSTTSEA